MKRLFFLLLISGLVIGLQSCGDDDNPCDSVTCQNDGTCNDGVCECPTGFTGEFCQTAVAPSTESSAPTTTSSTCTPGAATGEAGLSPAWEDLACLNRGEAVSIQFDIELFDSLTVGSSTYLFDWLVVHRILDHPVGLEWEISVDTIHSGSVACALISGTVPSDVDPGCYLLDFEVTLNIAGFTTIPMPIENPMALSSLLEIAGGDIASDFSYFVRIAEDDGSCVATCE